MNDPVEPLRAMAARGIYPQEAREAADEIERLRGDVVSWAKYSEVLTMHLEKLIELCDGFSWTIEAIECARHTLRHRRSV